MNFRRKKRGSTEIEEFDMTSLLDILVILLIFLLKSFNDSDLSVDLANELALPFSLSRVAGHHGVILQVNKNRDIFVNRTKIGNISQEVTFKKLSRTLLEEIKMINKGKKEVKKSDQQVVNLVFDKGLKFVDINKIMEAAAESGFGQYKLIVQGEE